MARLLPPALSLLCGLVFGIIWKLGIASLFSVLYTPDIREVAPWLFALMLVDVLAAAWVGWRFGEDLIRGPRAGASSGSAAS